MKVVLDTNVWLSALFWEGEASKIIEIANNKKIDIILSKDILSEIIDVLNKEAKFQKFIEERKQDIEELIRFIIDISSLIETKSKLDIIKEHPADNIILEAALDGKAELILSYNKHILNMLEFRSIKIMTPTEFLKII